MNNRAVAFDVETTGINDDDQTTEIGWCGMFFDAKGELQPNTKVSIQRCKPEKPISFGSMAITHIYDNELIGMPPHNQVIPTILDDSITYVIGHNIDFDMKIVKNSGVNHQYKRICSLAIARACYPVGVDHKLTAMLHMLDYEFARTYAKNAHSAKFDVMFCVRILRIMCANNNITNMEQLYQFSQNCRVPKIMGFGKHAGEVIENMPLDYKEHMVSKDIDIYTKIAFERSIAKHRAKAADNKRIINEQKVQHTANLAAAKAAKALEKANEKAIRDEKNRLAYLDVISEKPNSNKPEPVKEHATTEKSEPNSSEVPDSTIDTGLTNEDSSIKATDSPTSDQPLHESDLAVAKDAVDTIISDDSTSGNLALGISEPDNNDVSNATVGASQDNLVKPVPNETVVTTEEPVASPDSANVVVSDSDTPTVDVIDQKPVENISEPNTKVTAESTTDSPKVSKKTAKVNVCTAPDADDIPPSFLPHSESSVPEQDDDFYDNPTSFDPMSRTRDADPMSKKTSKSADPYGAPKTDITSDSL